VTGVLFEDPQGANLKVCERMIEQVLVDRGLPTGQGRIESDGGPAWKLRRGSADIFIFLTPSDDGTNYLQVTAPVLVPSAEMMESPKLYRRLLELNAEELTGAAFGMRGQAIVITADRSTQGLDMVEVEEMIERVSAYADHFDDALTQEFGGVRHSDL
jgi:hypothetical protein